MRPVKYLNPADLAPQSASDRLGSAEEFLRMGKAEIQRGRREFHLETIREGAEKVFHALVEATNARLLKYGSVPPPQHREVLILLEGIDPDLHDAYEETFSRLHILTYYQGVVDMEKIEACVGRVEEAIGRVRRYVRGR